MKIIKKGNKKWLLFSLLAILLFSISSIGIAFSFKNIFDLVEKRDFTAFRRIMIQTTLLIFLLSLSYFLKEVFKRRFISSLIQGEGERLFSNLLSTGEEKESSGKVISFFTNELTLAVTSKSNLMFSLFENGLIFLFALFSLIFIDRRIAIAVLFMSLFLIFLPRIFSSYLKDKRKKQVDALAGLNQYLSNFLEGLMTVKSYGFEREMEEEGQKNIDQTEKALFDSNKAITWVNNLIFGISFFGQFLIILIAALLIYKGFAKIGIIIAVGQLMSFISEPISQFLQQMNEKNANEELFQKMNQFGSKQREYGNVEKMVFQKTIQIKNLSFSYGERRIFEDLNFTIHKGEKIALLGGSGTGKSTLFRLLTGEILPDEGEILIDDEKLEELSKDSLRHLFQKVHQNTFIFHDSIKENVCLYEDFKEEDYRKALEKANILDRIDELEKKTKFSETEEVLSGGEKQRLQIARAFLRNKQIYLFDEITSNLDGENAKLIENSLKSLDETVLAIRHRIDSSLLGYDRIMVLEHKKLLEISYEEALTL
ncbi:MAG: ABC transporter ATP-binding protein [Tissierellia bacterium]|nr:ABC transporter ATP-binding protein [Tissierellia bacterium]